MTQFRADEGLAFMLQYENVAWYDAGEVRILDRRIYPAKIEFVRCKTHVEVMQAMQRPADKIAFGFQGTAGRREHDHVVSVYASAGMTVGGATAPLSGTFRIRLKTAFDGTKYKLTFYSDMDEWLKCHLALILPVCYVCYACNGDLTKATAEQRKLMLDAAWEGCRMLKAAGVPVNDAENTSYYEACTPGRKKMDRMMLMMTKTPLGRLCASDHAMHAVEEMHYHDEAFEAIRATTRTAMPAWDTLRNEMPSWKTLLLRAKHRV